MGAAPAQLRGARRADPRGRHGRATSARGAGLPGLVLADRAPGPAVTLVEPLLRRTTFLDRGRRASSGSTNVEVVRGRAEALHGSATLRRGHLAGGRSAGPAAGLVDAAGRARGRPVAMKGSSVAEEIEAAAPALRRLGAAPSRGAHAGRRAASIRPPPWCGWPGPIPARVAWPPRRSDRARRPGGSRRARAKRRRDGRDRRSRTAGSRRASAGRTRSAWSAASSLGGPRRYPRNPQLVHRREAAERGYPQAEPDSSTA